MNLGRIFRPSRRPQAKAGSLQFAAAAFVVLVCLVILGLDAVDLSHARQKEIEDARQETSNLARSLTQHAEDIFRTADASIVGVVNRLQMDGVSPASLRQLGKIMAARLAMVPALGNWLIVDETGACLAAGRPLPPQECKTLERGNVEYHRAYPEEAAHVGVPMQDASGAWLIPLSRRFERPDGSFGGIVVAGVSIEYFQHFYDTFKIGEHGAILLATVDGTLLVRRPFAVNNIGRDLHTSSFFRNFLSRNRSGDVEITSLTDGVTRFNSYRHVEGYPLAVSVAFASDEVLAPWRAELRARLWRTAALILVLGALGMWLTRQIRKHQRLEDAYHKASTTLRVLTDNSTDLIIQLGPRMERVYVSPASEVLLGYTPEEMLGHRTDDILYPEDRALWETVFGEASVAQTGDLQATYRVFHKDGRLIWVEVNRRRLRDGEGFVIATRNVTRRKAMEGELAEAYRRLELLAREDGLTSLANRRHFDMVLDTEFRRARRDGSVLSLIMIDVDKFKLYNDRYGHPAGDSCLRDVAGALKTLPSRPGDLVARYGGEEMVIVLPNTPPSGAVAMAERARHAVRALAIPHADHDAKIVTISLGVASLTPDSGIDDIAGLMEAADRALYRAKESGRDRVCLAAQSQPQDTALSIAATGD